jgi:hypothetical protein
LGLHEKRLGAGTYDALRNSRPLYAVSLS